MPNLFENAYLQLTLFLNFPEMYLESFLPARRTFPQAGRDLACGWGRASLTLRDYRNRHVTCCDLTQANLDRLEALAVPAGLLDKITLRRCDVTALPFDDGSFDFFLAFDIFEHLTEEALERCVDEVLRCTKVGCVLYGEIPLHAYCPAVTHIQNFSFDEIVDCVQNRSSHGRRFVLKHYIPKIASHFSFAIVAA